jgi:methionine synthase I (cobalamin-dependent)
MVEIAAEMCAASPEAFILIHANAGLPVQVDGNDVFPETPEMRWRHTPAHIRATREAMECAAAG